MKFINAAFVFLFLVSCSKKPNFDDYPQMYPPYRLIKLFSKKLEEKKNLLLTSYGINNNLPKGYEYKNGIGNFVATYSLFKKKSDKVSLDEAREVLVYVAENLLKEINSDPMVIPDLDVYPFTSDLIHVVIRFKDENHIELGQGISRVFFSDGKIEYEGYNISEYRNRLPAVGKHYTTHEESYEDALEIVKKQGSLTYGSVSI